MSTSRIALDTNQYVRVNFNLNPVILEANEGEVRVVVTQNQPAKENAAYHRLNDRDRLVFPSLDANVWVLANTSSQKAVVTELPPALVTQGLEPATNKTLQTDAWGRSKSLADRTLLHGMFTYNVPVGTWYEMIDDAEQASFVSATSADGLLNLTSGLADEKRQLRSFRNPRYEPNRGHLYSASILLPSPNNSGERSFGLFTDEAGAMFRLRNGNLYAVRRNTAGGTTTDTETLITLPSGIDLSKGNIFDIQFQWRGVGNYYFFVNLQLVATLEILGTLDGLSIWNPATPVAFESINQGDEVNLQVGCVDVTSEGGENNGKTYGSIGISTDAGQVGVSGLNIPTLVVRNKRSIGANLNTRDVLALLATSYADQRAVFRVWATRDETAITLNDQTWSDFGDGHIDYIEYDNPNVATPITFDTSKATLIFTARVDQDQSYATSALFEGRTEIYQTPGDIFIFTMHRETGGAANVGVTYEFAEAI